MKRTNRSQILLRVLDCINRDDCDDYEGYLIFGGTLDNLLDRALGEEPKHPSDQLKRAMEITKGVKEAVSDIVTAKGRLSAQRRASLHKPSEPPATKGFDRLRRAGASGIVSALADSPDAEISDGPLVENSVDALDAYFAKEVLGKLPRIVNRVCKLDSLDIQGIPNERVKHCFGEAHRCWLYGFNVASAVLCRAIIESALEELIKLHEQTPSVPRPIPGGAPRDSKLKALIERAKEKRILTEDGAACAESVKKAGNAAAHPDYNPPLFKALSQGDRLAEVLANTRQVLRELYGQVESR